MLMILFLPAMITMTFPKWNNTFVTTFKPKILANWNTSWGLR